MILTARSPSSLPLQTTLERRRYARIVCQPMSAGWLQDSQANEPEPAHVCNVSRQGAGLQLRRPLACDLEVIVHFEGPSGSVAIPARVAYCVPSLPEGEWRMGCSFLRLLASDEVLQLV